MIELQLRTLIKKALAEDIGMGDLSTSAIFTKNETAKGLYTAKADGVIAGLEANETGYRLLHASARVTYFKKDGELVKKGERIAEVAAPVQALLTGERVILNIVQHLSGIATATRQCIEALD